MPIATKKGATKKADDLFATFMKLGGTCEWCGKSDKQLQCAHVIGRSCTRLRWNPLNALCLCAGCHFKWHKQPFKAVRWYDKKFPGRYECLETMQRTVDKPDIPAIITLIQGELDAAGYIRPKALKRQPANSPEL